MLLEALIISACLHGPGCNESTSAYYLYNKDLQSIRLNVDNFGKAIAHNNQWAVYTVAPVYAVAAGQTAHIKLYKTWMVDLNIKNQMVGLQWSY